MADRDTHRDSILSGNDWYRSLQNFFSAVNIMLTPIERLLFRDRNITHALVDFALSPDNLLLTLAPMLDLTDPLNAYTNLMLHYFYSRL